MIETNYPKTVYAIENSIEQFYDALYECTSQCETKKESIEVTKYLKEQYPKGCSIDVMAVWESNIEALDDQWEEGDDDE